MSYALLCYVVVEWQCGQMIQSDGPVYALCCLDGLVVSAGSGSKISVWRSLRMSPTSEETLNLHKTFDTQAAGVWSLTVCRNRLISGGADGTIRVWT